MTVVYAVLKYIWLIPMIDKSHIKVVWRFYRMKIAFEYIYIYTYGWVPIG